MKKIKLKERINGIHLANGDMQKLLGGTVYSGLYCECRINLNKKTEDGKYVTVDLSNFMPNESTASFDECSAACHSACGLVSGCIWSAPSWGESGA